MARINYPKRFFDQQLLFEKTRDKHVADGSASPLTAFLAAEGISLTADALAYDAARTAHIASLQYEKDMEKFRRDRDDELDPVFKRLKGEVQFLKGFYKSNPAVLGDWGITVNENRIEYPADFLNRVDVWNNFYTHHADLGDDSPLTPYLTRQGIDIDDDNNKVTASLALHNQFLTAAGNREIETQNRNNEWLPVMEHVRAIGDFLKKLFKNKEQKLGDWGYTVDDSRQTGKERTSTLLLGQSITINAAKIGSVLTNIGTIDIEIYKGKEPVGAYTMVPAGGLFGIQKGFSTITVKNPSLLETAKFKVSVTSS